MQGFKSFPDKTKLVFENGTTVIVGPNGSGKSNISDAMRWVLGEISSKSIRGTKMEDIVFGGADSRKPMSFAEVSVTFDNTDKEHRLESPYDEVTITRRFYRAGDSEYFINRRPVRLKDIYELFMNTGIGRDGYSIIGQGKIAEIISRRSEERRSIFEDASGIAKYRHKKNESERKLKQTEENMIRANDIFAEVAAQLGPLEKDAEKAKRAIELLEAKKRVDVQLWLYDTEKLRVSLAAAEEKFRYSSFDLQAAEEALQSYERQNDKLFEDSQSNKKTSSELLEKIRTQTERNYELDSRIRLTENEINHNRSLITEADGAVGSINRSIESEDGSLQKYRTRLSELKERLETTKSEHAAALEESGAYAGEAEKLAAATDKALYDLRALEKEAVDIRVRLSVIENASLRDTDKNTSITGEIEEYERRAAQYSESCRAIERQIDEYNIGINKADAEISKLESRAAALKEEINRASAEHERLKLDAGACRQRIETYRAMEEQFEGYTNSVRFIMKSYADGKITNSLGIPCGRIYGPLSKLIGVEDRFVTAIETALGANLQHIVVEDESVAKSAMMTLKRADAGRATFFPLTSMRGQGTTPDIKDASGYRGYLGVASELVRCDSKFSEIVSNLLGRTVIFDNIDNATAMAKALKYRVRTVTLDGQQINFGGSFTGGSTRSAGSILGRAREIKRLEAQEAELAARIENAGGTVAELEKELEVIEDSISAAGEKRRLSETLRSGETAQLEQVKARFDANNTLLEKLRADIKAIAEQRLRQAEDIEEFSRRDNEIRMKISEISDFRTEKDIERNALLDKKAECDARAVEIFIRISEIQKDIETANAMLDGAGERMASFTRERSEKNERIKALRAAIERLTREQADNKAASRAGTLELDRLNEERAKAETGALEFEKRLGEVNAKIRDKMAQKENIFREHTKIENTLNQLRSEQEVVSSRLWDEYQMTRAEATALGYPPLDEKSRQAAASEQISCRNRLRVIGSVDLDAVNKYSEVKERYDKLKSQITDLEDSRKDLLSVIDELEGDMESAFLESFNKINDNFNRVFSELFGGGSAQLSLTDPSNVLESGIEISAAPPGKIIKNLMLLSGGEQAFVAIALFFAILQVNPTPFCILDEIEAALDEVNVGRFAEYIKKYSDETQFVLITHRRGTMEAANRLYGVTMPERGISKVLALNIEDISRTRGEEWDGIF